MKLYALKFPDGMIDYRTVSATKNNAWGLAFDSVAAEHDWFREKYWKRWDASLSAAKRLGYQIVEVAIVEA